MIGRFGGPPEDNGEEMGDEAEIIAELLAEQEQTQQRMKEARAFLAEAEEKSKQQNARVDAAKDILRKKLGDDPRLRAKLESFEKIDIDHNIALENLRKATAKALEADEALLESNRKMLEQWRKSLS